MATYLMKVTDFRDFSLDVGEFNIEDGDISDPNVATCSKKIAKDLQDEQPEMLNRGLCLTLSDEGGTVRLVAPMGTIH